METQADLEKRLPVVLQELPDPCIILPGRINGLDDALVSAQQSLIAQLKLYPDMFKDTDPNALIERAYDVQGDRIASVEKGELEPDAITVDMP